MIADFCYQEYIDTYGDADMSYVSAEEGYKAKFKGLKAYAYFRNTPENKSIINEATRVPEKLAKPYKVIVPIFLLCSWDLRDISAMISCAVFSVSIRNRCMMKVQMLII